MKTILIVEDMELNIDLLTQILEERYTVRVARDGPQGLTLTKQYHPDLVLMDISLPVMDGYEVSRILRQEFPSLPIFGISAHAMPGDDEKARAAGCNEYLTKPVDEDLLLEKLAAYIG